MVIGEDMASWWRGVLLVSVAAGCCHAPPAVPPRAAMRSMAPVSAELPPTEPQSLLLDGNGVARPAHRTHHRPAGLTHRRLTETDTLLRGAVNAGGANLLDDENRVPPASSESECGHATDELRQSVRYHAALELRNRSAAEALERFFQLVELEARTDLLRMAFPVLEELITRSKEANAAGIRFPFEAADLLLQRSQLVSQLEQAEYGSKVVNLDLKRRLGLPYQPESERFWPSGEFAVAPEITEVDAAVEIALADRPELRGLRALYLGLTPETLPEARTYLRAGNPLLGTSPMPLPVRPFARLLKHKNPPAPTLAAELEVRRKQLGDLIADRERQVADESRVAALAMNTQAKRVGLAHERLREWEEKLAEAVRKRDAKQPGAEFQEPQVRTDWLKARGELVAEIVAWHQARVRLWAAQGRLAWDATSHEAAQRVRTHNIPAVPNP